MKTAGFLMPSEVKQYSRAIFDLFTWKIENHTPVYLYHELVAAKGSLGPSYHERSLRVMIYLPSCVFVAGPSPELFDHRSPSAIVVVFFVRKKTHELAAASYQLQGPVDKANTRSTVLQWQQESYIQPSFCDPRLCVLYSNSNLD